MRCKPSAVWLVAPWLLAVWLAASAWAVVDIADTGKFVIDTAGVIDSDARDKLEKLLGELERKTTAQVKVLTLPTTGDEDIFDFSQRTYRSWQLGQKEKNNGALIVLAVKDRKVRIHTGYGLEGVLPDTWIGSLSRQIRDQYFRAGQYSQGMYEMSLAVIARVAADAGVTIDGLPVAAVGPASPEGLVCPALLVILFVIVLIWLSRRNQGRRNWRRGYGRSAGWGNILYDVLTTPSSGGWSSGGSGGGFGGSFGGGGGSFGGGGSSGGGGGGSSW